MREDMREGGPNTISQAASHNAMMGLPESSARRTMAIDGGCGIGRKQRPARVNTRTVLLSLLAAAPLAMAQNCIPLTGSTQCPAFQTASISVTDTTLVGFFPFLKFVSDRETFDQQLKSYVSTAYVQSKYQNLLGCTNINLQNTSDLYARFTTTTICNAIIQNSKTTCKLSQADSRPVCAETCAQQASSEAIIISDRSLCSSPGPNAESLIRADFTNCALPANSLGSNCVDGTDNEPNNCGFGNSTIGFCQYCAAGGQNSTDTCCYNAGAEQRCANVKLPTIIPSMTFSTGLPTSNPTSSATSTATGAASTSVAAHKKGGLSPGAIAGIVIGVIALAALIIVLIILLVMCLRRRKGSQHGSVFNQPSPARTGPSQGMAYNPVAATTTAEGYEVLPGGRIARMSALEGHSGNSPPRKTRTADSVTGVAGATPVYSGGRRRHHDSSSDEYGESPMSSAQRGVLRPPPAGRRHGSLSSNSVLGDMDPQSPISGSGGDLSSPHGGVASQQSEQLPFFKDYYSQDEIHPGDKVATLWAYQPRAGDEFALERGDMLKVVGIWDDGWATGVLIDERADEWDGKRNAQRDSGVSNTSGRRDDSPAASGEIKAFPLVCVCVPDHWKKTIEGDGSTETGSSVPGQHGPHS